MGFSEAISTCYSKFLVFEGRASRSEFWYFRLFVVLANFTLTILVKLFSQRAIEAGPAVLMIAAGFLLIVPDISVQVRRFHDRGISGLWLLPTYVFIPGIAIYALYAGFSEGIPLGRTQEEAFALLGILWLGLVFFAFVVSLLPGQKGANRFGADPLETIEAKKPALTPTSVSTLIPQEHIGSSQTHYYSNQRKDMLPQVSATVPTATQNNVLSSIEGADEASAILLKYNDEARAAYRQLNDYPVEWQNEYRQRLVENPSQDPAALVGIVVLKFLGRPDLAWSSDIWDALESARKNNNASQDEFIKVFSLLSHTMTPRVIADKVISQTRIDPSRGTVRWTYLVSDAKEVEQEVHYYSGGYYNVAGSSEFFPNIEDVYAHLNTPKEKRVKPFLLNTVQRT